MKWEMTFCRVGDIERYLKDGWEPFAVTTEVDTSVTAINYLRIVWLRRKVF